MRIDFNGATRRSEKDSQCIIPIFYSCKDCSMGSLLSENPEIFCRDIVVILPFYDNVFHRYVIRFVEGEKEREKKEKTQSSSSYLRAGLSRRIYFGPPVSFVETYTT